jgi:chromate reductase
MSKVNILAIPGSLRANSSSHAILRAAIKEAPSHVEFTVFDRLGKLPHFDDSSAVYEEVEHFRRQLKEADGVLICTPEYAFGVPGSLKNALDWTVSSGELVNKPVALITASTGGEKGHAALLLILTALSANVVEDGTLLVSFVRAKLGPKGEVKDPALQESIQLVTKALSKASVPAL